VYLERGFTEVRVCLATAAERDDLADYLRVGPSPAGML
jgi:hypothetical protein